MEEGCLFWVKSECLDAEGVSQAVCAQFKSIFKAVELL